MTPDSAAVSLLFGSGALILIVILAFGALRNHLVGSRQTAVKEEGCRYCEGGDDCTGACLNGHGKTHTYPGHVDPISEKTIRAFANLHRFKIESKVLKVWDGPDVVLASGECVKDAESAEALKSVWERDMRYAFPMGADYNIEYHCTITPLDDDEPDDDDDGTTKVALTEAASRVL